MGATVAGPDGKPVHPEMGSYGIGVSRLVGAVIEASHDDAGIIWPDSHRSVQGGDPEPEEVGDAACEALCEQLYGALATGHALYDDRVADRAGAKFADADLMGHPWQIVVGPRGAAVRKGGAETPRFRRAGGGFAGGRASKPDRLNVWRL